RNLSSISKGPSMRRALLKNGDLDMSDINNEKRNKTLPRHRLILLASAGVLGATMLFAGPGGYLPTSIPSSVSSARAADSTVTQPASFADLVAKVKPGVVPVLLMRDELPKRTSLNQTDQKTIHI